MTRLTMTVATERLRLAQPFHISGYVFEHSDVVVVTLSDGTYQGRGEGGGVYFLGDDVAHMTSQLASARSAIEASPTREELRQILPPGGARNAVDGALWELEAARSDRPVWQLAGLSAEPTPLRTTYTLGADTPEAMAQGAVNYADARAIKIKLTGDLPLDMARVEAIHAARPDAWLSVDGNQGFTIDQLDPLVTTLRAAGVALLEQPLARTRDADLEGYKCPIPVAGDESIVSLADVAGAVGRFNVINIKLDKCGGLTEGLLMAAEARRLGLGVMVGNMVGSSLAMAPAFVLGQFCDIVDLDSPIFLAQDRTPGAVYRDGDIHVGSDVWGTRAAAMAAG
ncbi:dipeptide epimerase [Niveispirillum irakense]|uniref:dipeptide epimerase n=1 Tax=Niveispirillum irakense TaxID=34011 RepID=UPI0004097AC6|nr:dipeptide epimerase [Niveispirillum irakense]